ncbi:MAG: tetratricopeptide repeat protein [Flavobacteriales bacterium]
MLTKQLGIIIACGLIGTALFLAPRTAMYSTDGQKVSNEILHFDDVFLEQLSSVKSKLEPTELFAVESFQEKFENAESVSEKLQWLDSLIVSWDRLMRPGISAEFAVKKAELSANALYWEIAGRRYTNMLPFFNGEDKMMIGGRAIFCLEQAINLGGSAEPIETQLAIARVEGSDDPMTGILKLREIAERNPLNKDAQLNLGYFSMQTGQHEKAIERFGKVLAHHPDELVVLFYISEAYLASGDKQNAIKALNDFISRVNKEEVEAIEEARKRIKNITN